MKIEHIAIWTNNLEKMKDFYCRYFHAVSGDKYHNPQKQFESYFLSFDHGARLELMTKPGLQGRYDQTMNGFAHFAVSVGSKEKVDALTEHMRKDGAVVIGEPRTTGDGYYESVVCDPDGNQIEITI